MQQIYRRTSMQKCDFRNHTSARVFSCRRATLEGCLRGKCGDEPSEMWKLKIEKKISKFQKTKIVI